MELNKEKNLITNSNQLENNNTYLTNPLNRKSIKATKKQLILPVH